MPRSRSERLLAINKEFVTQEKELREKYHDVIFGTAEKIMKTSQSSQIKALKVRVIFVYFRGGLYKMPKCN